MRRDSALTAEQRRAAVAWFAVGYGPRHTAGRLGVRDDAIKALYERW